MKNIFLAIALTLPCLSFSQQIPEFQTTIYVSDLNGHTDSVVVGYDVSAGYYLNNQFGEISIATPWDSIFEVRLCNLFSPQDSGFFTSKKRISMLDCDSPFLGGRTGGAMLGIKTETPVIITWNPQDFQTNCRDSSVIYDDHFFTTYPIFPHDRKTFMKDAGTHGANFRTVTEGNFYLDLIEGGVTDTIFKVYIGFFDDLYGTLLSTQQQVLQSATQVFPNPAQGSFTLRLPDSYRSEGLRVIDVSGRVMYEDSRAANEILVSTENWARGIYFYQMQVEGGFRVQGKVAVY